MQKHVQLAIVGSGVEVARQCVDAVEVGVEIHANLIEEGVGDVKRNVRDHLRRGLIRFQVNLHIVRIRYGEALVVDRGLSRDNRFQVRPRFACFAIYCDVVTHERNSSPAPPNLSSSFISRASQRQTCPLAGLLGSPGSPGSKLKDAEASCKVL
ncbi:MAG: hypothetical protein RBT80_18895 [Candidatus Vecturithrix sp.]|nr:hypothetical protein [Candidatus Vecturithrix sp.]